MNLSLNKAKYFIVGIMKLQRYIDHFYNGSNTEFAVAQGVKPQQVTQD